MALASSATHPPRPAASPDAAGRAAYRRFERAVGITLALVYLLILAGAIVRATGSGMGCPDWPRCFGLWIPPTDVSQLPADYATRFAIPGHVPVFNAFQTCVEYLNRLLGAFTGLTVAAALLSAVPLWRADRGRVLAVGAALVLVGFNAWLGKLVVDSVLAQGMITVHLLAALAVVVALLVALRPAAPRPTNDSILGLLAVAALALALLQLVLGTQVRSAIDAIAARLGEAARPDWVASLGGELSVHRALAAAFALLYVALGLRLQQTKSWAALRRPFLFCVALVLANAAVGFVLTSAGFPAWAQPLHLLGGTLLVGAHVWFILLLWPAPARARA